MATKAEALKRADKKLTAGVPLTEFERHHVARREWRSAENRAARKRAMFSKKAA